MYMYVHDVGAYMYMQGSYQLIVRKLTVYRQYKLPVQLEPTLVEECHARFEVLEITLLRCACARAPASWPAWAQYTYATL